MKDVEIGLPKPSCGLVRTSRYEKGRPIFVGNMHTFIWPSASTDRSRLMVAGLVPSLEAVLKFDKT